jgi:hypothetical protein
LVPVAKACPLAVDLVSAAAVAPCRGFRLAHQARLATREKSVRVTVRNDTL